MNKQSLTTEFIVEHPEYAVYSHQDILDNLTFMFPGLTNREIADLAIYIEDSKEMMPTIDDIWEQYGSYSSKPLIDDDHE